MLILTVFTKENIEKKKTLRKRKQPNSFPCNKWFDNRCKHEKHTVNVIDKLLKQPNNPDLISQ